MKKPFKPYTGEEIELAKQLYAHALATNTVKARRGLIAVGFSNGAIHTASCEVTWRDYLPDARAILEKRRAARGKRRKKPDG